MSLAGVSREIAAVFALAENARNREGRRGPLGAYGIVLETLKRFVVREPVCVQRVLASVKPQIHVRS